MRKKILKKEQIEKTAKVFCNKCGKELKISNGLPQEGVCAVDITWGYFSDKDGQRHLFDLCEACYDEIIGTFTLLPTVIVK